MIRDLWLRNQFSRAEHALERLTIQRADAVGKSAYYLNMEEYYIERAKEFNPYDNWNEFAEFMNKWQAVKLQKEGYEARLNKLDQQDAKLYKRYWVLYKKIYLITDVPNWNTSDTEQTECGESSSTTNVVQLNPTAP